MDEYRESLIKWLITKPEEPANVENAKSIVAKLTDAEVATLYLAVNQETLAGRI